MGGNGNNNNNNNNKPAVGAALRAFQSVGDLTLAVKKLDISVVHGSLHDSKQAAAAAASVETLVLQFYVRKMGDSIDR